jgi:hypothetical protein
MQVTAYEKYETFIIAGPFQNGQKKHCWQETNCLSLCVSPWRRRNEPPASFARCRLRKTIVGQVGARGSVVVKALSYKPEGRGFHSRWGEFLNLPNPSGRTRPWGFTQPLTEMSIRGIKIIMFLGSKARLVRKADNLTALYEPIV